MSRPAALILLMLSASLALPACSPAGTVSDPTATRPAHASAPASPAHRASTSAAVRHAGAQTLIFETPLPSDSVQAAVIRDFRTAQVLWVRSDTAHRLVAPIRSYLTRNELRRLAGGSIRQFKITGDVPAGSDRMFQTRVTVLSAHRADISTCDDSSGYRAKNLATGNVDTQYNSPPNKQYLYETWHMTRLGAHWAIASVAPVTLPDPRAKPCQP
ncbi:MAG: hypothetical protein J2P30_04310 [Actinobacteria bacterium]|nr:hypothetical protein [Actinomycetota bacterium]